MDCLSTSSNLAILEYKESDIFSVVYFVLSEHGGRKIFNPDPRQLVAMNIVVLKTSLQRRISKSSGYSWISQ